jgi:hypothetical protein
VRHVALQHESVDESVHRSDRFSDNAKHASAGAATTVVGPSSGMQASYVRAGASLRESN